MFIIQLIFGLIIILAYGFDLCSKNLARWSSNLTLIMVLCSWMSLDSGLEFRVRNLFPLFSSVEVLICSWKQNRESGTSIISCNLLLIIGIPFLDLSVKKVGNWIHILRCCLVACISKCCHWTRVVVPYVMGNKLLAFDALPFFLLLVLRPSA